MGKKMKVMRFSCIKKRRLVIPAGGAIQSLGHYVK
jgi:hypothetical protein